jgi:hypothetical protein
MSKAVEVLRPAEGIPITELDEDKIVRLHEDVAAS